MRIPTEYVAGFFSGMILGSMLTLLFLRDRVDLAFQHDFDKWSSFLFFALIAVVVADLVVRRLRKAH